MRPIDPESLLLLTREPEAAEAQKQALLASAPHSFELSPDGDDHGCVVCEEGVAYYLHWKSDGSSLGFKEASA